MDENKNVNDMGTEPTVQEDAVQQVQPVAETADQEIAAEAAAEGAAVAERQPQKKPVGLIVGIIAAVIALVAILVGVLSSNPKTAVLNAFNESPKQGKLRMEELQKEVPALQSLFATEVKPTKTNFDFSFQSVDGEIPEDIKMLTKVLAGFGVSGSYVNDPEGGVIELDGALGMSGTELLGFYLYASPELIAGNVPTFSDTVVSISPKTFAEDVKASPLYPAAGISDEELAEVQMALDMQMDALQAVNQIDAEKMQEDMFKIMLAVFDKAAFEKAPKVDGMKTYTVTIPGADMKAMVVELMQYIYIDSPVADIYEKSFPAEMMEGKSYKQFMQEDFIAPAQAIMPNLDTVMTVQIDKVVRSISAQISPEGDTAGNQVMVTYTLDADNSEYIGIVGMMALEGETLELLVEVSDQYTDGTYTMGMNMAMGMGEMMNFELTQLLEMNKEGASKGKLTVNVMDGVGMDVELDMLLDGTVTVNGDNMVYDFPAISITAGMGEELYSADFSLKADSAPVTSPYALSAEHKPLFSMSEEELMAETQKYQAGAQNMMSAAMGMFFGADIGMATPEAAVPDAPAADIIEIPTTDIPETPAA